MANNCPECGYPLQGNETSCPECDYPIEQPQQQSQQTIPPTQENQQKTQKQHDFNTSIASKTDWAQYFYECGVIGWEVFKKYANFSGRASRREMWSLELIFYISWFILSSLSSFRETYTCFGILFIIFLLPNLGAQVRRLHDIGKSGWWCLCPIANLFLYLKRSDTGDNEYGSENPAKNLL